jgi:hypothetical protein
MRKGRSEIQSELESGLGKYLKTLGTIDQVILPNDAQNILSQSAQPLLQQVVSNLLKVVKGSKNLARSFNIYRGRKGDARYKIYVGPSYGKLGIGQAAHLIEYGTVERTRRSISEDGKVTMVSTGAVKARPFMRPAWEQTKAKVMGDAEKGIIAHIDKKLKQKGFK